MGPAVKSCHTQGLLKTQALNTKEDCIYLFILAISLNAWLASVVSEAGLLKLNMRFLAYHSCQAGQGFSSFSENKNHLVGLLKHKFMNLNSKDSDSEKSGQDPRMCISNKF